VEQVAAGAHPEDVAVTMGFHKNTVYGWLAKVREGGKARAALDLSDETYHLPRTHPLAL
jgi:hypothetical protein